MLLNCGVGEDTWVAEQSENEEEQDEETQAIEKDVDAWKDWRQEEKVMTEDEMVGSRHWLDGHEFEQALGSWWCHPAISSSVIPFSCPQSFPASGSFPRGQFFISGGQSIGISASASVLPMNIQDWFPSGWTGWVSLQSKGLSRVFSNTTVQKHQFFGAQFSLQFNSHIHIWWLENP